MQNHQGSIHVSLDSKSASGVEHLAFNKNQLVGNEEEESKEAVSEPNEL